MESSVAGVIVKVGTDFNHSDIMTNNGAIFLSKNK